MAHRFSPIPQRTLRTGVAASIRGAILEGSLPPGSQLVEARIAEEMGVSRAPVREALRHLEEEGLVVSVPYKGTFVARLGPEEIEEISTLRTAIEPFAVRLAWPALRGAGLARLEQAVQRLTDLARAGDAAASVEAHLAVHRTLYELAGHRLLLQIWGGLEGQLRLYLGVDHLRYATLDEVAQAHVELLELVRRGDQDAVLEALVEHVRGPAQDLAGRLRREEADAEAEAQRSA